MDSINNYDHFSFAVSSPEKLGSHLKQLLGEAEMRLQELGGLLDEPCGAHINTRASFSSIIGNAYPASTMTGKFLICHTATIYAIMFISNV